MDLNKQRGEKAFSKSAKYRLEQRPAFALALFFWLWTGIFPQSVYIVGSNNWFLFKANFLFTEFVFQILTQVGCSKLALKSPLEQNGHTRNNNSAENFIVSVTIFLQWTFNPIRHEFGGGDGGYEVYFTFWNAHTFLNTCAILLKLFEFSKNLFL